MIIHDSLTIKDTSGKWFQYDQYGDVKLPIFIYF